MLTDSFCLQACYWWLLAPRLPRLKTWNRMLDLVFLEGSFLPPVLHPPSPVSPVATLCLATVPVVTQWGGNGPFHPRACLTTCCVCRAFPPLQSKTDVLCAIGSPASSIDISLQPAHPKSPFAFNLDLPPFLNAIITDFHCLVELTKWVFFSHPLPRVIWSVLWKINTFTLYKSHWNLSYWLSPSE